MAKVAPGSLGQVVLEIGAGKVYNEHPCVRVHHTSFAVDLNNIKLVLHASAELYIPM